eukprot:Gb_24316 [translate_table: standard]
MVLLWAESGFVLIMLMAYFTMSNAYPQTTIIEYNATYCSGIERYEKSSTYEANLEAVLQSIAHNASFSRFNIFIQGQASNRVFALFQCRGDLSLQECSQCVSQANILLQRRCNRTKGAQLYFDGCYLRYNSTSFFNQLDMSMETFLINARESSNPTEFNRTLETFLVNLISNAVRRKGHSINSTTTPNSEHMYGVTQCRGDMSETHCRECLQHAVNDILGYGTHIGARVVTGSCYIRFENNPSFLASGAHFLLPSPSPTNSPSTKGVSSHTSSKLPLILGLVGGVLAFLFILSVVAIQRGGYFDLLLRRIEDNTDKDAPYFDKNDPALFTYEELKTATEEFHSDNKLGEGVYGSLYKGILRDGRHVAIKKLNVASKQEKQRFLNEVGLITTVQHRNLVRLIGCCLEGPETLLVYEYMPNRSLDKFIFNPQKGETLQWPARLNIIVGVARGLTYLHDNSEVRIVHRDIKASNILLDEKLDAKITDFAFAKLFDDDTSHVSTSAAGTFGYMAPEYAMHGHLTEKADIFSFGILVLEVVTGRKSVDMNQPPSKRLLLEWVWTLHEEGDLLDLIDPTLDHEAFGSQIIKVIKIALLCTQAAASLRPPMSRVMFMLSGEVKIDKRPTKPAFLQWKEIESLLHRTQYGKQEHGGDSISITFA